MNVNIKEAERALTEKPLLSTASERFLILNEIKEKDKDLPQPTLFANQFKELLSRVSTPIEEYDLIAGRMVDRELTESEEKEFQEFLRSPYYPGKKAILNSGHCTFDWQTVVDEGLEGLTDRARRSMEKAENEDERIFLSAMIEIYTAISEFMLRYAKAAEEKGMTEVAQRLKRAACGRPQSFEDALQLLWTIAFINCAYITENTTLTLGRLDKMLYPLYENDIKKGILTRERAGDLITDYYCKFNLTMGRGEHQVGDASNSTTFKRILNFDAPEYLLIAGTDEKGESAVNPLTELFAEKIVPSFKNPVVVVRYFKGMNVKHPELWSILTKKAMQSSSMMFYNDDCMLSTLKRMDIPDADAREYEHFGCNWPSVGHKSTWMNIAPKTEAYTDLTEEEKKIAAIPYLRVNSPHGLAEDIMVVLESLAERPQDSVTMEDVYKEFFDRFSEFTDRKLDIYAKQLEYRQRRPSAMLSYRDCFLSESIENRQNHYAGAKYHFGLQSFQMFGTVTDCFTVTDKLVFIDKKLTLRELVQAAKDNFVGHENVLAMCRSVEKYGSDSQLSNYHAHRISHTATDIIIEKNKPYNEKYRLFLTPCMQSDTWHLKYGETYGATVDGRLANTPFSQNTRPSNGACINGITGMLNSMLNLPEDGLLSGALNLDINPDEYKGESGIAVFGAILGEYFNRGGLHAQVTAVNADTLIDAKKHPESHRDIRVRVTGYSGIFVDICEKLQDDIIERTKNK